MIAGGGGVNHVYNDKDDGDDVTHLPAEAVLPKNPEMATGPRNSYSRSFETQTIWNGYAVISDDFGTVLT